LSYKVSFVTRKVFKDNTEKITVKNGFPPNPEKTQRTKRRKKREKEFEYASALQAGQVSFDSLAEQEKRLAELDRKYSPKLKNAVMAMNRAKNNLMDILRSNDFTFFVTLTFDNKKVNNSMDDKETRLCFRKWRRYTKDNFPDMVYIAVEEYQKRRVLHYHLLVGNITAEQLGFVNSGRKVRTGKTKGQPIFNITKWKYGFSTATEILEVEACKRYLSKYLTKTKADPRFFGKKRYFCSQNIKRPAVEKFQFPCNAEADIFDSILKEDYLIEYEDSAKEYTVLTRQLPTTE
jgi:hypothetical protein